MNPSLKDKTILLGIGGGIAAYKCCELARLLVREGADLHCVLTKAAHQFVTPLTLKTLSKNKVLTDLFDLTEEEKTNHIAYADRADFVIVAPASADLIAKAANGLADDLLTTLLLATRAPVLFCPSMNVNMWEHRATQHNVGRLKELGYQVLEPSSGELACGWEGKGRLPEPEEIFRAIKI